MFYYLYNTKSKEKTINFFVELRNFYENYEK